MLPKVALCILTGIAFAVVCLALAPLAALYVLVESLRDR